MTLTTTTPLPFYHNLVSMLKPNDQERGRATITCGHHSDARALGVVVELTRHHHRSDQRYKRL